VKILCCLNADVVSSVALNLLLPSLASHDVHVALSTRVGKVPDADEPRARQELRMAEQGFANDVLFPLIERAAFSDDGRFLTFGELDRHRGIRVSPLPNPNNESGQTFLRELSPDLIISIRYGAIFKAASIGVPRLGILNLHAGLLPAYRGVIASFRALMADESEIGCTLHYVSDGTIDTGAIVGTSPIPVDRSRSLLWHVLALYPQGIALVADALARLERGETLATRTQAGGTYYTYPTAVEWDEFLRRGWRVADPSDLHDVASRFMSRLGEAATTVF
jgi:methionyl-tRNA formyltransferase